MSAHSYTINLVRNPFVMVHSGYRYHKTATEEIFLDMPWQYRKAREVGVTTALERYTKWCKPNKTEVHLKDTSHYRTFVRVSFVCLFACLFGDEIVSLVAVVFVFVFCVCVRVCVCDGGCIVTVMPIRWQCSMLPFALALALGLLLRVYIQYCLPYSPWLSALDSGRAQTRGRDASTALFGRVGVAHPV